MNIKRHASLRVAIATGVVLALGAAITPAAHALGPASDAGWLRLGHLSPETKDVDVRVASVTGAVDPLELEGVGYGDISGYQSLPSGDYTISMVPSGAEGDGVPVISETITIDGGTATTVAAYGPTADLQVRAFEDDLAAPAPDQTRIRVISASTLTPSVNVAEAGGTSIAEGVQSGVGTDYADLTPGEKQLDVSGGELASSVDVDLASGAVTTLFVLDTADAGITIKAVVDSKAAAEVPRGGVDTGGGFTAQTRAATPLQWLKTLFGI